jgi:hypothetical protein
MRTVQHRRNHAVVVVDPWPYVVGDHGDGVAEFFASLSPQLRDKAAGSSATDPHTMKPDVHAHAATVMAGWEAERQRGWLRVSLS